MPLQNRVNPSGDLIITPHRGMFTGNRGIIHNDQQQVIKAFMLKAWITCTLTYKNFRRQVMTGRKWTELFFLDEATAFAAGHRPCAFCRNPDYKRFKKIWLSQNAAIFQLENEGVANIDNILHHERMGPQKTKKTYAAKLSSLPDGIMFTRETTPNEYHLWYREKIFKWDSAGYTSSGIALSNEQVQVLTPESIVRCFNNGYTPIIHNSVHDF